MADNPPKLLLLATLALLPLLVLQGTRFGFELPKAHLAVLATSALVVLAVPRLKRVWQRANRLGQVMLAAGAVLGVAVGVSTLSSDAVGMSVFGPEARFAGSLVVITSVGLVAAVPAALSTWRDLDLVLGVLAGTLTVAGLIVVSQQVGWPLTPWPSGPPGGVLGTLGNANFVGMFGALGAPLAVYLWFVRPETRLPAGVLAALTVTTMLFAGSDLGALAAAVGASAAGVALLPRRLPRVQGWLVAAAPLGGVIIGLAVVVVGRLLGEGSAVVRWSLWQSPFGMITDNAFSGVGWARLRANYLAYRQPETVTLISGGTEQRADSSHAWVIDLAANSGLPALLAMLTVVVVAGLLLRRCWLAADPVQRPAIAGITGLLAAHGVGTSLSVPSIVGIWVGFLLLGLSLSTATVDLRPRTRRRSSSITGDKTAVAAGIGALVVVGLLAVPHIAFHRGATDSTVTIVQFEAEQFDEAALTAEATVQRVGWWSEPWMVLARVEDARNNLEGALDALEGALEADPLQFDAILSFAQTHSTLGNQGQAEAWFARLVEVDPYGFRANSRRAQWALGVGRLDIAREALDTIELGIEPGGAGWSTYLEIREAYEVLSG